MTPINPVLESNQSRRRTEGPIYWSPGSTAHLNAFWYPFCFPWKERFHYTFFYYWMEDSAEGNSDGSKIKRWHFNYRTLIKARGWWLWTRPPLIVPPDVLIKWDRVGGGNNNKKKGHRADTKQRRSSVGIWEYGCPGPAEMKTHVQTKRAQYPRKRPRQMRSWSGRASIPPPQTDYQYRSRPARP